MHQEQQCCMKNGKAEKKLHASPSTPSVLAAVLHRNEEHGLCIRDHGAKSKIYYSITNNHLQPRFLQLQSRDDTSLTEFS